MPPSFQLCYITDRAALAPRELLSRVAEAARSRIDLIQIREKDLPTRALGDLVSRALASLAGVGTPTRLVVNDRLDVALALGAHGVHLGTRSLPARAVRRIVPAEFLVGVSCHSLDEAREAEAAGADYLLLGPIFETPSKLPYGPPLGLDALKKVTAQCQVPVLALGGITVERVRACLDAGAAGIAGISLFQNCASLDDRVRELRVQCEM